MGGIAIVLVLVCGPKSTYFWCRGEVDLVFVCGSKTSCFCVCMEIGLVFVMVVKVDIISVWGIELDLIHGRDEIDLVVV